MGDRSFRDILTRFLEEKPAETSREKLSFSAETPSFHWQNPKQSHRPKNSPYPASSKPVPRPALEPRWKLTDLSPSEQQQVAKLIQLGAAELSMEISLTALKTAHRRLAKRFHPDTASQKAKSQENFLALQSIYEGLSKSLKKKSSESAGGSGSASAPASQRPNAA